jgi:hypothetical protein
VHITFCAGTFFHYKVHAEQRQIADKAKAKAAPAEVVDEVGARTGTRTKKVVVDPDDSTPPPHARSLPFVSTPPSCPPDTALLRRWPAAVACDARAWSAARARSVCDRPRCSEPRQRFDSMHPRPGPQSLAGAHPFPRACVHGGGGGGGGRGWGD